MSFTCKEPKLRFPEFSGEWVEKKLEELSEKISDGIHSTPEYDEDGIFHFINGNNLVNGKIIITDDTKKVSEKEYLKYKKPLGQNTILLSINGTIGNLSFFNDEKVVLGKSACFINIDEALVNKFFVNDVLKTDNIQNFFYSEVTGSTIKNLSLSTIKNTKLFIPSKPEQEKIASFLTAVDAKIEQLTCKEKLLEKYKKSAMQKLFSGELRFTCNDGSEFPEWEEKRLDEVTQSIKNGLSLNQNSENNGYKVTRIETISDTTINMNKVGYVTTNLDISNYKLEIGDMLFSNINSVKHIGKIAYVDKDYNLYHGMNLLNIKVNQIKNNSKFIYYLLTSKKYKNHFETICNQAVSQASINQTDLKKIKLLLPQIKEQTKIANFLSAIDEKLLHVKTQIEQTKQFKKALLQQMFV